MGDEHNGAAAALEFGNRLSQGRLTRSIQIGVGLIEHHQSRVAVQRTGQRDALFLTAGQASAIITQPRVVALRQAQNQFVYARQLRGSDHSARVALAKARDIFCHGATEQLDVLRQITNIGSQRLSVPAMHVGPVQTYRSAQRWPDTDQHACQGRLAGTGCTQYAEYFTGLQLKAHLLNRGRRFAGRRSADLFRTDLTARCRQWHARRGLGVGLE